jgi:ABC-type lipoprotein release transport system permease subunit
MNRRRLTLRALTYYWRTNLAVVAGVATAVAVLAGALVVGDSVRGTLRQLALDRIGATDFAITSPHFVREALANDIASDPRFMSKFAGIAPLIVTEGLVTAQVSGRRAGRVLVYGVDERFWRFHGVDPQPIGDRDAIVSPALAAETGLAAGDAALVRVQRPSPIPLESLHSDKDAIGRTLRVTIGRVLGREPLSDFALQPRQGEIRAMFVPLRRLQTELEVIGRANTLLVARGPAAPATTADLELQLRDHAALTDVGLKLQPMPARHALSVEADAGLLTDEAVRAVDEALDSTLIESTPMLTYVANEMRIGGRAVPYSLVTAIDLQTVAPTVRIDSTAKRPPIVLNDWAASDLAARPGDELTLDFYMWGDSGGLSTRTAAFQVAGVVPVGANDRDFAPSYPGITDSPTMDSWDPPFPVDLRKVRPRDELYWERYRTAPKAFVPLDVGQELWASRHGRLTSLRLAALAGRDLGETVAAFDERLRSKIDPVEMGAAVFDVRGPALAASQGATDFGEYFLYFSFFLVVAALVLVALFFRLGVEQRSREVGLLRAVGVDGPTVRRLLTTEAVLLSTVGTAFGLAGALGYAWLVITALGTWWVDAVGTTALAVHVAPLSLVIGAVGGMAAAIVCTWWTLRGLGRISERSLLAGDLPATGGMLTTATKGRTALFVSTMVASVVAVGLVGFGVTGFVAPVGAFFGAGGALLAAGLFACAYGYRTSPSRRIRGRGWWSVSRLGLRSTKYRPGRSVLSIGVIAAATFILIAVDAFRKDVIAETGTASGTGGYDLIVESLLPIVHDPSTAAGRQALNLPDLGETTIERFRLRPGDDASCLNLYQPQQPRILGATEHFVAAGRFAFQGSLATAEANRVNPWRLLEQPAADGVIPVIADITSMNYVLHRALGEEIAISTGGRPVRLRIVAALRDSVFQSELIMSEANFRALFPEREGYQVLLVDTTDSRVGEIGDAIENGLADLGADAVSTVAKLAEFHRVENTYLSTFQTLGGLGLLIGTIGLGTVLLRNVLERRRELALLGALGYRPHHFVLLLTAESLSLLLVGLVLGAVSAGLAVLPAVLERGGHVPVSTSGALLIGAVLAAGLLSTTLAARLATRGPLLEALKAE